MRTGIVAAIDPRASAGEHLLRIRWVHRKAEHVGIVKHAFVNGGPVAATINGFPRKMKRPGVDDLRVLRVDGERIKVPEFRIIRGRDHLPIFTRIARAEYSIERAGDKSIRIRRRCHKSTHSMADETGRLPRSSPISAAIDSAAFALLFARPNGSKEKIGVSWVNEDRRHDSVVR